VARKIEGYYKQINFENLRCAQPGTKPARCRISSLPFDRAHMLFIEPTVAGEVEQSWRIDPPVAVKYDRCRRRGGLLLAFLRAGLADAVELFLGVDWHQVVREAIGKDQSD
jgi:hypothetical protein